MAQDDFYTGVGRRKSSTVTVRLTPGKGKVTVNGKAAEDYFAGNNSFMHDISQPLAVLDLDKKYDANFIAKGGGHSAQVDAAKLATAKAISSVNDDFRSTLKKEGLLSRDARAKERKKPGLKSARKKEQFSKR